MDICLYVFLKFYVTISWFVIAWTDSFSLQIFTTEGWNLYESLTSHTKDEYTVGNTPEFFYIDNVTSLKDASFIIFPEL